MVKFQADILALAIDAAAAAKVKDLGSDLPAEAGAALALDAFDVGIGHEWRAELVAGDADAAYWEYLAPGVDDALGVDA